MSYLLRQIAADTAGQDLAEYGIALSVIALGVALVAAAIAGDVNTLWSNAQTALAAAV
jgi:Flp pilus assembly pilin Flp